jgi:phosphoglycerate dehydrogenase-like enzyme
VKRRLVIDLADARGVYALPAEVVERIRGVLPADWDAIVVGDPAEGTGDGGAVASTAALDAVREAEIYMGFGVPETLLLAGPMLRWVHSGAAGVRASLTPAMLERDIVFTNSAGIHGPPVAETVMAYLLHFARAIDHAVAVQARRAWDKDRLDAADSPVRELSRSTVGVVGLGGIGREVAWRASALGARVVGTRRTPAPVVGVDLFTGSDALSRVLAMSDYLVLALPETGETEGMVGADELALMKPGAVLVNVARGGLVDESALLVALTGGRLRGAALDVFETEPLPADHPLRDAPNLLITPHTAAYSPHFWEREADLILDNLGRYLDGTSMRNVVDKRAGY